MIGLSPTSFLKDSTHEGIFLKDSELEASQIAKAPLLPKKYLLLICLKTS